ncbi:hypothetical protein [Agriterribacter sp.]|uniref:hypothetical protein n=1 Tax=Agriterribacter sp. TaxID=2821509 RepID=UPI002CC33363|nr:hypothetical protein [Agriterribacter sp.]HRP56281.1 hypothetical protein [Agriterribacter sp.]
MKEIFFRHALLIVTLLAAGCSKEKDSNGNCKTCRALGGLDQQTIEEKVCSEEEKKSFADRWVGREIMCN